MVAYLVYLLVGFPLEAADMAYSPPETVEGQLVIAVPLGVGVVTALSPTASGVKLVLMVVLAILPYLPFCSLYPILFTNISLTLSFKFSLKQWK